MSTASVRYIVDDVAPRGHLLHPSPGLQHRKSRRLRFAAISRSNLQLLLSTPTGPGGTAAQPHARRTSSRSRRPRQSRPGVV